MSKAAESEASVQDWTTLDYHAVFVPRLEYAVGRIQRRGKAWRFLWEGTRWAELRPAEVASVLAVTDQRVLLLNITARLTS